MHIKLEEKRAQKGLQTAMRRSGHKSEKDQKKKKKTDMTDKKGG